VESIEPTKVIFVDESDADNNIVPLYGWSKEAKEHMLNNLTLNLNG
jgi:hypothetical protein